MDKGKPLGIVACGSLRGELEAVLAREGGDGRLYLIAPAPCIDYASMKRQLEQALRQAGQQCSRVLVAIGRCHPDLDEILAPFGAQRVAMDNCFDALLGGRSREVASEVNTFFTTPAWLKQWRRFPKRGVTGDGVDLRQNFGLYRRILLLDTGTTAFADEDVLRLFDDTGVEVEVAWVDLGDLARLLRPYLQMGDPIALAGTP